MRLWTFGRLVDFWYRGGPSCPPNLLDYWSDVEYRSDENGLRGMSTTGGPPRNLAASLDGLDSPVMGYAES